MNSNIIERGEVYLNIISEQYEVVHLIARTNHSEVYLVRHKLLDTLRVAKVVRLSGTAYNYILAEANLMKNFKHPGIPLIYDIIYDNSSICIIEEYISGNSLTECVTEHRYMDLRQIIDYGIQICNILEYMHNFGAHGVIHLDLKPDNIIVDGDNKIHIIDFDHSHILQGELAKPYGTVGFAAPEQYHRLNPDCRADIYSLGMLLLYLSNGGQVQSNVDSLHHHQLYPIINKCLKHNPVQRYCSVRRVRSDLEHLSRKNCNSVIAKSHDIYIYGTKRGVGTTHIALYLTSYLSRHHYRAVCMEQADPADLRSEAEKGKLTKNGLYLVHGAYLLPDYQNRIQTDLATFDFRIHDCGVYDPSKSRCNILIMDFGYRMEQEQAMIQGQKSDTCILVNHCSGQKYYEYLHHINLPNQFYRIPCIYDWWKTNNLMDETIMDLLSEYYPEQFVKHISFIKTLIKEASLLPVILLKKRKR